MKHLILVLTILLFAGVTFAQNVNKQWSNENVQTISGTITDNQRPSGAIKALDGNNYIIHFGPIWYWNNNNYDLLLSDATIKGNVKTIDGEYHIYPFTIEQGSNKITLADDDGTPKWRKGNGYGNCGKNGNGNGRGNCNCRGNGNGNCWRNK
jgi:hypothetical protein